MQTSRLLPAAESAKHVIGLLALVACACSTSEVPHQDPSAPSTVDADGDGVADDVGRGIDADGDGVLDPYDADGDGKIDGVAVDTNGDALPDAAGVDTDGDGIIDSLDTDGDGVVDVTPSIPSTGTGGGASGTGGVTGSGSSSSGGTASEPPSTPGVFSTLATELPGGQPTACEWEWTGVRSLTFPGPNAQIPRSMYHASCNQGPQAKLFSSVTVGPNAKHPEPDPTSGSIIVSALDDATGTLSVVDQKLFPECRSTHGIAVSDDCQTIGVLCRIPYGTPGWDKDLIAEHPEADWLDNDSLCGNDKPNDQMWLYEWTNGDIQSTPKKYIVHKSIGSWEYGNNYLRLGSDNTWGIAVKATTGGNPEGTGTCHEADSFFVLDRNTESFDLNRGWFWSCAGGHTLKNRIAFDKTTNKYAALCSTDGNPEKNKGVGSYVFHMEDGEAQQFQRLNYLTISTKGAASAIVSRPGGGFLGLIIGVSSDITVDAGGMYPKDPPTEIGLVKWDASGNQEGEINWIAKDATQYVSYSTLVEISQGRYLFGYGIMPDQNWVENPYGPNGVNSMLIPKEFWLVEIDEDGKRLTEPMMLDGAGWGELDEMAPLGQGRAGWGYIDNPAIDENGKVPPCNQDALELSVYTSPTP